MFAPVFGLVALGCAGTSEPADTAPDTGGDPAVAVQGTDQDNDSILDIHEGEGDADDDGLPNALDPDSDGDTILDAFEAGDDVPGTLPVDSDLDGTQDFLDLDSDANCLPDEHEAALVNNLPTNSDDDAVFDFQDADDDGDLILDLWEVADDCTDRDSDGDGVPDRLDLDSDGDGIGDAWEAGTTDFDDEPADTDGDGVYDFLDGDSDSDGATDSEEGGVSGPEEEPRDTDGDGVYDFADTDSDADGISDQDELGLTRTDPYDPDTDGDGYTDGAEDLAGTDPLASDSFPDGLYIEVGERTWVEEELEFDIRIQQADVAFLLDSTCSMTYTLQAMASEFSSIVTSLALTFPDAEYGFATFDDYAYGGFGQLGVDMPYILRQQVTSSTSLVQTQLSNVPLHNGVDGIASTLEAIYQASTGIGYDQNCDTRLQPNTDVPPLFADASDPFGGLWGQAWSASSPGGGDLGGMAFRDLSLPIIVYASDTWMRDSSAGYGVPGGCPDDATSADVVSAIEDLGARLLAICVGGGPCSDQMEDLAEETGALADLDGDGADDDLLVVEWTGSDEEFRETVVGAIEDLVNSIEFETVELRFEGDEWGFVSEIQPEVYEDVDELGDGETTLTWTIVLLGAVPATTEDQLFQLTMNVIGDESVLLDTQDVIIVVPGRTH